MQYEEIIKGVCGDYWNQSSWEEKQGGYAVGCVIAFLNGVNPELSALSAHLGVPVKELSKPYSRLLYSGVFSDNYNAKGDLALLGKDISQTSTYLKGYWDKDRSILAAWCHIAAIGSGAIERNIPKNR